jgi:hypothetical protein
MGALHRAISSGYATRPWDPEYHPSAAAWGHLNLLGEYDFSEDKLQDSVGIKPPKLTD